MRPATFTREQVTDAALAVARGKGWRSVTMRATADVLGVTPMALYRVVTTADDLRRDAANAVGRRLRASDAVAAADLSGWAAAAYRELTSHPGLAAWVLETWTELDGWLEVVDVLLGAASGRGASDLDAVEAVNAVFTFVLMRAQVADSIRRLPDRTLAPVRAEPDRFPNIARNLDQFRVARVEHHFEVGLATLLRGLGHRHGRPRRRR